MKYTYAAIAALLALSACGDGNPFFASPQPAAAPVPTSAAVPAEVAGSVADIVFDDVAGTLSVTGLLLDGDTFTQVFNRRAGLDQGNYQAYTFQDDPLDEHTTVYVRRHGSVEAGVAVTGGQFTYYSGGVTYKRAGGFDPVIPDAANDRGLASYAGAYVGLSNLDGPDNDLNRTGLPGGLDPSVTPGQAAVVNGSALINVEFATNNLKGEIYDRSITLPQRDATTGDILRDAGGNALTTVVSGLPDLILVPTTLQGDGTFAGTVELNGTRAEVGDYGGIVGGPSSDGVAGGVFASEHFDTAITVTGEEEYGVFVIGRCGTALQDDPALCGISDP